MLKKIAATIATATMIATGAVTATATPVQKPVQAGDGFYITDLDTAHHTKLNMYRPANLCTITAIPKKGFAITAGHCFEKIGQPVWTEDGDRLGTVIGKNSGYDIAMIKLNKGIPSIVSHMASRDLQLGDKVMKKGTQSGVTEGEIISERHKSMVANGMKNIYRYIIMVPQQITIHDVYEGKMCAQHGDSGAPVYYNGVIVGLLSSGDSDICSDSSQVLIVNLDRALTAYAHSHQS